MKPYLPYCDSIPESIVPDWVKVNFAVFFLFIFANITKYLIVGDELGTVCISPFGPLCYVWIAN